MPVFLLGLWSKVIWPLLKLSIPIPLSIILAIFIWWQIDKTSSVRHAVDQAVEGYTHTVELTAAKAEIAELKRQKEAGESANAWLRIQIATRDADDEAARKIREQKDAEYVARIKSAGRAWYLDDADIKWLLDDK